MRRHVPGGCRRRVQGEIGFPDSVVSGFSATLLGPHSHCARKMAGWGARALARSVRAADTYIKQGSIDAQERRDPYTVERAR